MSRCLFGGLVARHPICVVVSTENSKKKGAAPKTAFAVVRRFDVYLLSPHADVVAFLEARDRPRPLL